MRDSINMLAFGPMSQGWQTQPQAVEVVYNYRLLQKNQQSKPKNQTLRV